MHYNNGNQGRSVRWKTVRSFSSKQLLGAEQHQGEERLAGCQDYDNADNNDADDNDDDDKNDDNDDDDKNDDNDDKKFPGLF